MLELEATDVGYGAIPASKVDVTPPPGAKVTEINPPTGVDAQGKPTHVRASTTCRSSSTSRSPPPPSSPACRAVRQPGEVRRRQGRGVHLRPGLRRDHGVPAPGRPGAKPLFGGRPSGITLPQVNIDGDTGQEIATALGTLVTFDSGGVSYIVAGSVPPVAAENAARGLR